MSYRTNATRLWSRVTPTGFCWLWTGGTTEGYGNVRWDGRSQRVHRVVYELLVGPIPEGSEIDHLCRIRSCCNPDHLDPVPRVVNNARGQSPSARNGRKSHCPKGHDYDIAIERRGGVERRCSQCERERRQARTVRDAASRRRIEAETYKEAA